MITKKVGAIFVGVVLVLSVIAVAAVFEEADAFRKRGPFCHGQPATIVLTNPGGEQVIGTSGDDVIVGSPGPDFIQGDPIGGPYGNDIICAGNGDDIVCSDGCLFTEEGGNDKIVLGKGLDQCFGEGGNDTIFGNDDMDLLFGGYGNDNLGGGPGDDFLFGEQGDDRLTGLSGSDFIDGGEGDEVRGDICKQGHGNIDCENIVMPDPDPF